MHRPSLSTEYCYRKKPKWYKPKESTHGTHINTSKISTICRIFLAKLCFKWPHKTLPEFINKQIWLGAPSISFKVSCANQVGSMKYQIWRAVKYALVQRYLNKLHLSRIPNGWFGWCENACHHEKPWKNYHGGCSLAMNNGQLQIRSFFRRDIRDIEPKRQIKLSTWKLVLSKTNCRYNLKISIGT